MHSTVSINYSALGNGPVAWCSSRQSVRLVRRLAHCAHGLLSGQQDMSGQQEAGCVPVVSAAKCWPVALLRLMQRHASVRTGDGYIDQGGAQTGMRK